MNIKRTIILFVLCLVATGCDKISGGISDSDAADQIRNSLQSGHQCYIGHCPSVCNWEINDVSIEDKLVNGKTATVVAVVSLSPTTDDTTMPELECYGFSGLPYRSIKSGEQQRVRTQYLFQQWESGWRIVETNG